MGIGISTCEEGIVEVEGTSTWENESCEYVGEVWVVWGIDESSGGEWGVGIGTSTNTNGYLVVSSRIGFKYK